MSIKFISFSKARHLYIHGTCVWFFDTRGELLDGIEAGVAPRGNRPRERRRNARVFSRHYKFCMDNWGPGIQMAISP